MKFPFTIAEIAQAHDGSLGMAHSYIDALTDTGVSAVKFQTHIAEAESSVYEPFRVHFSRQDASRFEYWKRMEFTQEQWIGLKKHCEESGMEFISSPFSCAAVDLLERIGVKRYKIASGEVRNLLMLKKIMDTGKPLIISSGMSSIEELDRTVELVKKCGNPLSLLQCTTAYPTKPAEWGLNVIAELKERYGVPVGFSDHSGNIYACLAAAGLGAQIFEFHIVFDQRQFGPDSLASIPINRVSDLVRGVNEIAEAQQHFIDKNRTEQFEGLKKMFGKSLAANKNLEVGHGIEFNDLESKKPGGMGIPAEDFEKVIGRRLTSPVEKWDFLTYDQLS